MDFGQESGKPEVAEKLIWDYRTCSADELNELDRTLCDFSVKLTRRPGQMDASDVQQLKTLGLNDRQITVVVQVIGYFNYINRVADGLDVELEDWMSRYSKSKWLDEKATFS